MSESGARTPHTLRARIHLILESGHNAGLAGTVFEMGLVALIVANVLAVTLDTVPAIRARYASYFDAFETFSIAAFTVEYALRLWTAPEDPRYGRRAFGGRFGYAMRPLMIIDLFAFAPAYFLPLFPALDTRILRVFRLLRLLKIGRYSPALVTLGHVIVAERRTLMGTLLMLFCVMCISAETLYVLEGHIQPEKFGTLPDAMWWSITTLTTVGYGDAVPITVAGKMVASITMVIGLGLFALPVGIVATAFVDEIHRRDFVVTWAMLSRVPLFQGFDTETLGEVMSALRSRVVNPHATVAQAGERPDAMSFVVSGQLEEEDPVRGIRDLSPGEHFGEAALLDDEPHETTVTAKTRSRLLTLSADDFAALARRHPELRARIAKHAAQKREG